MFLYFRVLPAEGFRVKVIATLAWNRLGVCLATNLDALLRKEDDAFRDEGIIEGMQRAGTSGSGSQAKGAGIVGKVDDCKMDGGGD